MQSTSYSLGPLWAAIREEHRAARAARAARKSLARELASYTSPADLNDLDAILDRHNEDETADIRSILAGRPGRLTAQPARATPGYPGYVGGMAAEALQITVGDREVRISHPGKILFPEPGLTKEDLVRYYIAVGEGMIRAIADRPTALRRYPDGVDGEFFFQKRAPKGAPPWVETVQIRFPSGRPADEICPTEPAVLAWAANLNAVEFHPWPVRRPDVDHPDELRIDLDPQPGTTFRDAVAAARLAREVLDEVGCTAFVKTSGGRGVHLAVRIAAEWDFIEVRRAAIALARELARRQPDLVTAEWWKEQRGERIFVDFNQAARDRSMAAAYSARATPTATVSAPVSWDELDDVGPGDFTIVTMPERFAAVADPHAGMDEAVGRLDGLLEMAAADERDRGLGDMPYPPDYPKMPGEPKRVQPSRARPSAS